MKALVQRVLRAEVRVNGVVVGSIGRGFLVLLGVTHGDTPPTAVRLAAKVAALRIFEDDAGRMNRSLAEADGALLCISQFTLHADVRRGNRPSFANAAGGEVALPLYEAFCEAISASGIACQRGRFGEHMEVELVNDGPVTIIVDTADLDRPRDG